MSVEIVPKTRIVPASSSNPVVLKVAWIRAAQDALTPGQRAIREMGRRRVASMLATGNFSIAPRR